MLHCEGEWDTLQFIKRLRFKADVHTYEYKVYKNMN